MFTHAPPLSTQQVNLPAEHGWLLGLAYENYGSLCVQIVIIIRKVHFAGIMPRYKRKGDHHYMGTISVNLPVEVIMMIDRYKKQTGNNRSLAVEYIVRDWKRAMDKQRKEMIS